MHQKNRLHQQTHSTPTSLPMSRFTSVDDAYDNTIVTVDSPITRDEAKGLCAAATSKNKNSIRFRVVSGGFASIDALRAIGAKIYHSSEAEEEIGGGYVMLDLWLKATPSIIPCPPSAALGGAYSVRDSRGRRLLVKEKYGPYKGKWKYATGTAHKAENAIACGLREVEEEVGLKCRYLHSYAFQSIRTRWSLGEATTICHHVALQVEDDDAEPHIQEDEIKACRWFTEGELENEITKDPKQSLIHERAMKWVTADLNHGKPEARKEQISPDGNMIFIAF
ncbi:Nudix hydrolase [Pandoravirus salinus]|uniref:Nudix hydrolase n=1 Tax=Pandoravirus salinus TaxID=1349410 RepID=S4W3H4_9VIRU|nr:Nudix hydrolase [Pandoravirus salinus]AGO84825.2 Nudix hydrolase [Pandoravirus salinus]